MTTKSVYTKELNLQKAIQLDCSSQGWISEHYESKKLLLPSGQFADSGVPSGYPDLTVYPGNGIVCFVECKVGKNKQQSEQVLFQNRMKKRGYLYQVIYNMNQWNDYKNHIIHKYLTV
jgi:hypothetical protein